jgi:hypothetical protein
MSTGPTTPLPGSRLHRLAQRLLDPDTVRLRVEPAIADLQHEARATALHGFRRAFVLRGGYAACLVAIVVNLLSGRTLMQASSRRWKTVAACCAAMALVLIEINLPFPRFVFALVSLVVVAPIIEAAATAGARWSLRKALVLACSLVPVGYLAGGAVGWASVPRAWTASLSVTIDASMNAAKYGAAFEHTAERVLLYFFFGGLIGALVAAAGAVAGTRLWWRPDRDRSPVHSWLSIASPFLCLVSIPLVFVNPVLTLAMCLGVALAFVSVWTGESASSPAGGRATGH